MSAKPIEEQLNNLQPSPSSRFYRRMARAAWTAAAVTRRRAYVMTGLTLMLAIALLAFTPQGRVWAQSILGFFTSTEKKTLPLPHTPGPVPTYFIKPALQPLLQTPVADPEQCGPTVSPATSTFLCQLINAQAQVGFEIKAFAAGEVPLVFNYISVGTDRVTIRYLNDKYPEEYILFQGQGDFPTDTPPWDVVSADAIQKVQVGIYPAEFVVGGFARFQDDPTVTWTTSIPEVRLRWQEGDRWYFIIAIMDYQAGSEQLARDRLIGLGQSLIPLAFGSQTLAGAAEMSLEQRVGFHIVAPASLPVGYNPGLVEYGDRFRISREVVTLDYNFIDRGAQVGGIWLHEAAISDTAVDFLEYFSTSPFTPTVNLVTDETVQIGLINGRYLVRADGAALLWEQDGVKLMLEVFWYPGYGGRLSRDALIAIAESVK